jgi:hypothetical protein
MSPVLFEIKELLEKSSSIVEPAGTVLLLAPDHPDLECLLADRLAVQGQLLIMDCPCSGRVHQIAGTERIQRLRGAYSDLRIDVDWLEKRLSVSPPVTYSDLCAFQAAREDQMRDSPLVRSDSVDLLIAVGILRRLPVDERSRALVEFYRVLKKQGRLVLMDFVSDESLSDHLLRHPDCPAAFQELELMEALESAKFHGIEIGHLDQDSVAALEGVAFRRLLIQAHKGKEGMCLERHQGVIYLGPWKVVQDDDGHILKRGQRFAVCDKTFHIYKRAPYAGQFVYIEPATDVPLEQAKPWDARHPAERLPCETKGTVFPQYEGGASAPSEGGVGYIGIVEWRNVNGEVTRRAKVLHRFKGCFEDEKEALDTARRAFPNASSYRAVPLPFDEVLRRRQRVGRTVACPITPNRE